MSLLINLSSFLVFTFFHKTFFHIHVLHCSVMVDMPHVTSYSSTLESRGRLGFVEWNSACKARSERHFLCVKALQCLFLFLGLKAVLKVYLVLQRAYDQAFACDSLLQDRLDFYLWDDCVSSLTRELFQQFHTNHCIGCTFLRLIISYDCDALMYNHATTGHIRPAGCFLLYKWSHWLFLWINHFKLLVCT